MMSPLNRRPPSASCRIRAQNEARPPAVAFADRRPISRRASTPRSDASRHSRSPSSKHAVQHRDHPRQVGGYQVRSHHSGSLAATGKVVERVIQSGGDIRRQGPRSAGRGQQIVSPRAQRYRRIDQLCETLEWIGGARAASIRLHLMRVQSAAFFRTYASAGIDVLPLGYDPLSSQCHWHRANAPGG